MSRKDVQNDEPLGCGYLRIVNSTTLGTSKRSMFSMVGSTFRRSTMKEKRCYFVLERDYLHYYTDEKKKDRVGRITTSGLVNVHPIMGSQIPNCFDITTTKMTLRCVADTAEDLKNWLMALFEVIPLQHKKSGIAYNPSLTSLPSLSPVSSAKSHGTIMSSLSSFSTFSGSMRGSVCIEPWISQKKEELRTESAKRKSLRQRKGYVYALLYPGALFKKYNKRCRAQLRRVMVDKQMTKILYTEPKDRERVKGEFNISDIVAVNAGCTTAYFPSSASLELQAQCFSIVTRERTLDLQVSEDGEKRNDWVEIFRDLVLLNWIRDAVFEPESSSESPVKDLLSFDEGKSPGTNPKAGEKATPGSKVASSGGGATIPAKGKGPPSLPPKKEPPALPPSARPPGVPKAPTRPPTKPPKLKTADKKKAVRRASSVASISSIDLEGTLSQLGNLTSFASRSQELSGLLDLDKLYAKGSPDTPDSKTDDTADGSCGGDKLLPAAVRNLRSSLSNLSTASRESTGSVMSIGSDFSHEDLDDDDDEPLELPTDWSECEKLVIHLKGVYKKVKHSYYKGKSDVTLKKRAIKSKAKLQAAEKHFAALPKPEVTVKEEAPTDRKPRSRWRARSRNSKSKSPGARRVTAVPWAKKK